MPPKPKISKEMILTTVLDITRENGFEAVKEFENSEVGGIDVILMDIMMPEMDGYSRNDGYFAQRQRIYRTSGC